LTRAHALEEFEKLPLLAVRQISRRGLVRHAHVDIELTKHLETTLGDVAEDLSPIG
jgi:hypothetical protein